MIQMAIFLSVLLSVFVAYCLLLPHLSEAAEGDFRAGKGEENAGLDEQKYRCLQVLKDLELDYTTGKIQEADYNESKAALSAELSAILRKIDARGGK